MLNSSGSFTMVGATTTSVANNPKTIASGDFNADGNLDIASVSYGSFSLGILLGNGNGTFQARTDYGLPSASHGVEAGDLDGDGDLDLAVSNFTANSIGIWLNNGSGVFANSNTYGTGTGVGTLSLLLAQ